MTQTYEPEAKAAAEERHVRTHAGTSGEARSPILLVGRHALLIVVSIIILVPFYWMISAALKNDTEIFAQPILWLPNPVRWQNIIIALNYPGFPYLQMLWNSIFYAGSVAVGTVFSCSLTAYGFARLRFPGRGVLFIITISTLMIPQFITFIPTYVLFKYFGLLGTYAPLIVPYFFGNAFFIFMLRQFFMGIPWDLSEAAKIDGASELRIFWQIMLPLVRPALIVVAVFSLLYTWQDFLGPLIYLSDPAQYPLSLGLFAFKAQRTTEWSLLMAASMLVALPMILVFTFAQRYFLQGITMTGLKG